MQRHVLLAAVLGASGCVGYVDEPRGVDSRHDPSFACDPAHETRDLSRLPRLSRVQYERALRDVLVEWLGEPDATAILAETEAALRSVPPDDRSPPGAFQERPYTTQDQLVSQRHVDTYLAVGVAIGDAIAADPGRRERLARCDGSVSDACVATMFRRLAEPVFRRPPSDAELSFITETYAATGIDPDGVRDVVVLLLNMPQFLYRLELGADPVSTEAATFALTDHELATRLALLLWQTGPDAALREAAGRGELSDPASYARIVDEMLADPRADALAREFGSEWLDLEDVPPFDADRDSPAFVAFAGDALPSAQLRQAATDEALAAFTYHFRNDEGLAAVFQSRRSFARSEELARLYRTEPWDGEGEPPAFTEPERVGMLSRLALLGSGHAHTRPIRRGVTIRRRFLCDELSVPPADAMNVSDAPDGVVSTREHVTALTGGGSCAGCHQTAINPLGFAFERFDALGRVRTEEHKYDQDGTLLASLPLDSAVTPRVFLEDTTTQTADAAELVEVLMDSGRLEACFSEQLLQYVEGRVPTVEDGCRLETMRRELAAGGSLRAAVRTVVLDPAFRTRTIEAAP